MNIYDVQRSILRDDINLMKPFNSMNNHLLLEDGSTIKSAILRGENTHTLSQFMSVNALLKFFGEAPKEHIDHSFNYVTENGPLAYSQTLMSMFSAMCIYYKWSSSGKVVYSITKEMADMLRSTADSEMHLDTLKYLPVNTFYFNLPEQCGKSKYIDIYFKDNDNVYITYIEDESPEPTYNTFYILLQEGKTLSEMFDMANNSERTQQNIEEAKSIRGLTDDEINSQFNMQKDNMRLIASILFYLASANAIIKKKNIAKSKRVKSSVTNKPLNIDFNQVGFYKGISFNSIKNNINEASDSSDKETNLNEIHQRKIPHIRRAHWHHYWIGSGSSRRRILKWLPPIYINSDPTHPPKATVIRDVF